MSSSRAAPVSAVFAAGPPNDVVTITMTELIHGPAWFDITNWTVRYNNLTYAVTFAENLGFAVVLTVTAGGADIGADVVSYSPPPFDVLTALSGLPVLPFTDFPVT